MIVLAFKVQILSVFHQRCHAIRSLLRGSCCNDVVARLCQNVCRCLQFSAQLGKVEDNIARANALLQDSSISDFDLLILPELAFTGVFPSRDMSSTQLTEDYFRLQFSLSRSDNALPGVHRLRHIFSMGQDHRSAASMHRHGRLS